MLAARPDFAGGLEWKEGRACGGNMCREMDELRAADGGMAAGPRCLLVVLKLMMQKAGTMSCGWEYLAEPSSLKNEGSH